MNMALQSLGSLIAIGLIVWLAFGLGLHRTVRIGGEDHARGLITAANPGAKIDWARVAENGTSAIARSGDVLFLIEVLGDRFAVRQFRDRDLSFERSDGALVVRASDLGFRPVRLVGVDMPE
jgi:hypothetical protein